jgi:hypothetical protein
MKSLTMPRACLPENVRVSRVLSSDAARSASRQASGIGHSGHGRNAVPNCAACAPSIMAAAIPCPFMMPPAAITGTDTAAATCGIKAIDPIDD